MKITVTGRHSKTVSAFDFATVNLQFKLGSRELLQNVYGFLGRFENRGGDVAGLVARHQARRRALTLSPIRAKKAWVLSHSLERLP